MKCKTTRKAFTLIELIAVMVVLAVLAGVALPRFFNYSDQAKEAACKGALGGTRAGIANFYADGAINGSPAYPTYAELTAVGTVMQEVLPDNPYNDSNAVRDADGTYAAPPPVSGTEGWAYDETAGKIWANSDTVGIDENEW